MLHDSFRELAAALGPRRRLLGLDVGRKTIGLAVSDSNHVVASPLETIRRRKLAIDLTALAEIIDKYQAGGIVIGLPISMDGQEGPACQSVRQFARNLDAASEIDIAFWDERFSTAAVQRMLVDEADMSRRRRAEVVDKMAAAYILQGAIDSNPT